MNWRHRVQKIITGEDLRYVVSHNNQVMRIIDKCRYKYNSKYYKKYGMNPLRIIKKYSLNGNVYKIETDLLRRSCGITYHEKDRRQAWKVYSKQHTFSRYEDIPSHFNDSIDWRSSKMDGSKWIVWEYIKAMAGIRSIKGRG